MKSKRVTSTWEFCRDNCEGCKEPMRKELRKLDVYVANIEAENAKLRELVRGLNWHIRTDGLCADCPLGLAPDAPYEVMCDVMIEELGIEVDA